MKIQPGVASGESEFETPDGEEAETISKNTSGNTAIPGEAVLYRKYTTKKNAINKKASSDSTWCMGEGVTMAESMAYSVKATRWKIVPIPTAGSITRVKTCRPPHRATIA